jgi:hypothetical protein
MIRCLNQAFPEIEGFVPKSQLQIILYTNNPSFASLGISRWKKGQRNEMLCPFYF